MLKPADQVPATPPERPVGELVHELIEDGKAYARAEFSLAKAVASAKGKALAIPAALLGAALLIVQAGLTALAVGVFAALYSTFGPVLGGFATFLIFAAIGGGLAWYAVQRLRRDL